MPIHNHCQLVTSVTGRTPRYCPQLLQHRTEPVLKHTLQDNRKDRKIYWRKAIHCCRKKNSINFSAKAIVVMLLSWALIRKNKTICIILCSLHLESGSPK